MGRILVIVIALCLSIAAFANDLQGRVVAIIDGNTLRIECDKNQTHVVQLIGIDSPELLQEYGQESKKYLEKIALGKKVTVSIEGQDRRGNPLAVVMVNGKRDLRVELLEEGLAWTSEKNPQPQLEECRTRAENKGLGLWKQNNPTPPWTFRRQQSMMEPKTS